MGFKLKWTGEMFWNGNELVFTSDPDTGVAGIAPGIPDQLGEEIVKRWNAYEDKERTMKGCKCVGCDLRGINPCPALLLATEIETLKNRLKANCNEDIWHRAVKEFWGKPVVTDSDKGRMLDCIMAHTMNTRTNYE